MSMIHLVSCFIAGDPHFVSIDNDNVVTGVHVRCIFSFVLASQTRGDCRSHATKCLAFCIDQQPVLCSTCPGFALKVFIILRLSSEVFTSGALI